MTDDERNELDELLFDHQEQANGLTGSQQARLNELLRSDPEARRQFARTQLLDAALHLQESSGLTADIVEFPAPAAKSKPVARPYAWIGAAAAVVFLLGLGLGSLLKRATSDSFANSTEEPTDDGVAFLARALDVEWTGDHTPVAGEPISPGRLQFSSGVVQLKFYSGAHLIVEGPADLDLVSSNEAYCRKGKLRARVPEVARGFTVQSPQFELVDLGTEFGIDVSDRGTSEVQVFDGEVEIYAPDGRRSPESLQRLLGGSGLSWTANGETGKISPRQEAFPSFEEVEKRSRDALQNRHRRWQEWSQRLADDSRVVAYYDFEGEGDRLLDRSRSPSHGTIVGSERTHGRWPGKGALEFKRPGDRVRIDIPGEFDQLTFATWLRMDALTGRFQSLVLTDGWKPGHVHWQVTPHGATQLGIRLPRMEGRKSRGSNYGPKSTFDPRRIGNWTLVCAVYDRRSGDVSHFLNGREISREPLDFDLAVQIGQGDIGNWSEPINQSQSVRNFVGRMDELVIWNAALTSDEIFEVFRETRP